MSKCIQTVFSEKASVFSSRNSLILKNTSLWIQKTLKDSQSLIIINYIMQKVVIFKEVTVSSSMFHI